MKDTASIDEARAAYLKLMRRYHPDQTAGASFEEKRRAEESARRLNMAYEAAKKARARASSDP